jgi:hypothetical protein
MLSDYIKWRAETGIDKITHDHPMVVKEASTKKAYFLGHAKVCFFRFSAFSSAAHCFFAHCLMITWMCISSSFFVGGFVTGV